MNSANEPETDQLRKNHEQLVSRIQILATSQQIFVLDQLRQPSSKNRFRSSSEDLSAYLKEIKDDIDKFDDKRYLDAYETIIGDLYKKFQYMLNAIKNATRTGQTKNNNQERAKRVYVSKQRQYPE